ncbi:MAG: BREX system ATP-binding domain-containing protein [Bradymonadaceae bacterium]
MNTDVEHSLHGPGRILSLRRGGHLALVEFEALALPTLIPTRELRSIGQTPVVLSSLEGATAEPVPEQVMGTRDATSSLLALEAMRLGVVPAHDLDAYTVGREAELRAVDSDLDEVDAHGGAARVFLADYGVGKTHLLELVQEAALKRNFLTARVVLDAREMAPSHPRRVFHGLMRTLRYPDRPFEDGRGLGPLLDRALLSDDVRRDFHLDGWSRDANLPALLDEGMHLYLSPALIYLDAISDEGRLRKDRVDAWDEESYRQDARQLLLTWLEGSPTESNKAIVEHLSALRGPFPHLYSLMDYRPWARIYSYLLSGIAALARAVGYGGLVVLFDEAELYSLLSTQNRDYAKFVFKSISCASLGQDAVPFDADELNLGGYGILQDLPPRYGDAAGLYSVFAMTPNADGLETLHEAVPASRISELERLGSEDYAELARRVCDFYASSRPDWRLHSEAARELEFILVAMTESGHITNPRQAMKLLIEALDIHRHFPDRARGVIRNLQSLASF